MKDHLETLQELNVEQGKAIKKLIAERDALLADRQKLDKVIALFIKECACGVGMKITDGAKATT